MDYYSLFWGPGVTSTINEPSVAFRCRSSTLAVFVDSVPFRGLLLTVLGSQSVSMLVELHVVLTCRSSILIVLADSGLFRGLLLTVFGAQSDFHD